MKRENLTDARSLILLAVMLVASFAIFQSIPVRDSLGGESGVTGVEDRVYIDGIPFFQKKPDFGGEACVAMVLQSLGHKATQDDVFDASGLDPILGRGCHTKDLIVAAKQIGFEPGDVWFPINRENDLARVWRDTLKDLRRGVPSVFCRVFENAEQMVLVIGHDSEKDQVIFHNPNVARGEDDRMDLSSFMNSCKLGGAVNHTRSKLVRIRLAPKRINVQPASGGHTDADFAQHVRELKTRLPHDDFKIVLQKPFVVVGDAALEHVQRSSTKTVKWAVDSIKQDYFPKDPFHIIDVWLFKDPASYKKHNRLLFDSEPSTPYGYYSPTHRVLVMDISTGGGTLVHEIVHPFMESNFEACPSWFNEGLASLYEQSSSRNGRIIGLTNWRLRGLQLAIEDDRVPSFKALCSTSTREFYSGAGTNYAQARYLCYYLQEKGLLIKYFHQFRRDADSDPTGYETLKSVLGRDDIESFQQEWQTYVSKLRFGS
jgi:hypothetical protein